MAFTHRSMRLILVDRSRCSGEGRVNDMLAIMRLSFTHEQYLDMFAACNTRWRPAVLPPS